MGGADRTLTAIRRLLLVAFIVGSAGTVTELLLIGHNEDPWQLVPIFLLSLGTLAAVVHAASPGVLTVRLLQALTVLFVASAGIGMALHYQGNTEFELEMHPSLAGAELVRKTMTGAFPVLAPGTMALLGLVGLALTHRHPALNAPEERS
jgi:hypothetical protein